jgi:aspartate kinase
MENERGTIVKEEVSMEQHLIVRGIAFEDQVTRVTVHGIENSLYTLPTIFTALAKRGINVDIIIQSATNSETASVSFSIRTEDLQETLQVLQSLEGANVQYESGLAKVSIVGSGMISNPGVAAQMFEVLADQGIEIKMVSTSEIKISTVIDEENMVKAVEALHEAFQLADEAAAVRS